MLKMFSPTFKWPLQFQWEAANICLTEFLQCCDQLRHLKELMSPWQGAWLHVPPGHQSLELKTPFQQRKIFQWIVSFPPEIILPEWLRWLHTHTHTHIHRSLFVLPNYYARSESKRTPVLPCVCAAQSCPGSVVQFRFWLFPSLMLRHPVLSLVFWRSLSNLSSSLSGCPLADKSLRTLMAAHTAELKYVCFLLSLTSNMFTEHSVCSYSSVPALLLRLIQKTIIIKSNIEQIQTKNNDPWLFSEEKWILPAVCW